MTVQVGAVATFSVAATGTDPLTYQWRLNEAPIDGATAASYTTPATAAGDNGGLYSVVVSNAAGSVASSAATLSVDLAVAPSIAGQPAAQSVVAPQTATFTVLANGSAPLSYQWRRNGAPIAGANAASYTTPATTVATDNGAIFSVVVSNGSLPNATSANATLSVLAAPVAPTIATQPANATVAVGASASFGVVANGTAPFTYQWRKNGSDIAGATGASYTTPATVAGDNGATFSVVVRNGSLPDATSNDATLTVNSVWAGIRQDGAPFPTASFHPSDTAASVATDAQGNVIIAGYTDGAFSAADTRTSPTAFIAKYSRAGTLLWARRALDNTRNLMGANEGAYGVATDAAGNIYITGQVLTPLPGEIGAGNFDVYIAKFDTDGNPLWAHQFGSSAADSGRGIAVDTSGNAFIVGISSGQLPLQPPPPNTTPNYFIAKYDTAGNRLWLLEDVFPSTHGNGTEARAVAVDAAGNAYLAGHAVGLNNHERAYVLKFNGSGTLQWQTALDGGPVNAISGHSDGIAVSADGNAIFLSGQTVVNYDVAGHPALNNGITGSGDFDAFVARFDGTGALQWAHNLSSQVLSGPRYFQDEAFGIATNATGSALFITGYTNGVMPGETSKGGEDIFAARFEGNGTLTWLRQLGSGLPAGAVQNDRAYGIALDPNGDLFIAGSTVGTFGTPLKNTDRPDWFVLKMKPADGALY